MSLSHVVLDQIEENIIKEFSKHWELNDSAHRIEHFQDVYDKGIYIDRVLNLGVDRKLIMFAAYFHDLFAWSRENHHLLSEEFVKGTCHPIIENCLTKEERILVAGACRKHRASGKEPFDNTLEELINSADRGAPSSVQTLIDRAMQYRRDRGQTDEQQNYLDSLQHVMEKYGPNGYARYPEMYMRVYGNRLREMKLEIEEEYKLFF